MVVGKENDFREYVIKGFTSAKSDINAIESKLSRTQSKVDELKSEFDDSFEELSRKIEKINDKVIEIDKSIVEIKTDLKHFNESLKETIREIMEDRPSSVARVTQLELDIIKQNQLAHSAKKDDTSDKEDNKNNMGKWTAIATISTSTIALIGTIINHFLK